MHKQKNIVVIGGGAIGLCTAHYLQQSGHSVTVIEKGVYDKGTSLGNAGMLVPSHVVPLAAPGVISQGMRWLFRRDSPFRIKPRLDPALMSWLWQFRSFCTEKHVARSMPLLRDLSLASVEAFASLATLFDFHFEQRGLLMVHRTDKGEKENLKYGKKGQAAGLDVTFLTADELKQKAPNLKSSARGAVYFPQDAHLSPNLFIAGITKALADNGVVLRPDTAVTGFETTDTKNNRTIRAVNTNKGRIEADEVILAAGAWTPALARMLRIKAPIQPAKGYSITVDAPENAPTIPVILTEEKVTITPMGNKLRFGGTLELAGFDASVDLIRARAIRNAIPDYLPSVSPDQIDQKMIWSGFRPCTPDGLPIIGRPGTMQNLVIASGHAMIGITLAPITGQLVTSIINNEKPAIDTEALHPDRFSRLGSLKQRAGTAGLPPQTEPLHAA
ncbi:MAG: FAD-dependent oxidoreductase [Bacteroidota bacterium]